MLTLLSSALQLAVASCDIIAPDICHWLVCVFPAPFPLKTQTNPSFKTGLQTLLLSQTDFLHLSWASSIMLDVFGPLMHKHILKCDSVFSSGRKPMFSNLNCGALKVAGMVSSVLLIFSSASLLGGNLPMAGNTSQVAGLLATDKGGANIICFLNSPTHQFLLGRHH